MSMLKYMNERTDLMWGRAKIDGAPFRGAAPPLLKEGEADTRLETVFDTYAETFDLSDPEQKARYLKVTGMVVNGWATLLKREFVTLKTTTTEGGISRETARQQVYIEWTLPFKEDNQNQHGGFGP